MVGKPQQKGPLRIHTRMREENITLDLQQTGWGKGMDWIRLAQDRKRCRTVVNAVEKSSSSIKCMETLDRLRNY